jgi:ribosomal peptide maturation radical SAM protein 1
MDFGATLRDADVLIIVPPFAALEYPSLAAHLLQACGREAGFRVQVLYANIVLASVLGEEEYTRICNASLRAFAGERFFARCAFGLPPLGLNSDKTFESVWIAGSDKTVELEDTLSFMTQGEPVSLAMLKRFEEQAAGWVDQVAAAVSERAYKVVGCTTMFEQTAASVSLLNRIKRLRAETVTIIGGANCEGEMAQGIASLGARIDYIFSGESEVTFPKFVRDVLAGSRPQNRLIYGEPCRTMDAVPTPLFNEFYEQRAWFLPDSGMTAEETQILYETSRGCWWGQKHHCTFCGLNGEGMAFRQKSPDRVIKELHTLLVAHPTRNIQMTDNIMPHSYFKTLVPRLGSELPGLHIFYEQKANLSLQNVLALRRAGGTSIQPGIEALSSRLLRRMKKGVQARQNLQLLRYARAAGLQLYWNLLWGIPGDELTAYEETLALLPLLHHLQPPSSVGHLSIDRFSPYFFQAAEFGVNNVRPLPAYYDFLPKEADVQRVAYHFVGDYHCGAHDNIDVIGQLGLEVRRWQFLWWPERGKPPELRVCRYRGRYTLVDTRGLKGTQKVHVLSRNEAALLLTARPSTGSEQEAWALQQKLAVIADDWFVPLAVADPEMLLAFEAEQGSKSTASRSPLQKSVTAPELGIPQD